jgi:transcriptional regulator with XRE-family HTH domain
MLIWLLCHSELAKEFFNKEMTRNYLQSNRKRLALSQDEVAFLIGARGGAKISRYERFSREPSLKTVLALQVIYQTPISELFSSMHKNIEKEVAKRAKILSYRKDLKPTTASKRKREAIKALANLINNESIS